MRTTIGMLAAVGLAASASAQVDFTLTVLHNNDGESQLINAGSGREEFGGVARFATLVGQLRAEAENAGASPADSGSIVISAGDNILAGPEFNASLELPAGQPFFDAIALVGIGYDVLGIGNHELDFGPDVFQRLVEDVAVTPFVSANLDFSNEAGLAALPSSQLASSTIVTVDGRQVGVIGATTENLPFISSPRDIIINNVATAVQAEIDALTSQGVNIIGLTSHLQSVDEELALVPMLSGIDFVIAGGGDDIIADAGTLLIPGDQADRVGYPLTATSMSGSTVPVVSTAGDYSYVGRLVLEFDAAGNVVNFDNNSNIVRVASITADPLNGVASDIVLQTQVVDPVAASVAALASEIIGTSEVGLDGVTNNVRSRETNLGNLITDSYVDLAASFGISGNNVVAIANGGGIRNGTVLPAGDLTALDTFDILPFSNFIVSTEPIPAAQFVEILENAVSRIEAGTGNRVGGGTGRFAQVSGVSYSYDARRPAIDYGPSTETEILPITEVGSRLREVVLADGTVIFANGVLQAGAPDIIVLTADFTARGGDEYAFRGASFSRVGDFSYQQSLRRFIEGLPSGVTAADYPEGGEGRIVNLEFGDFLVQDSAADVVAPFGETNFTDLMAFVGGLQTQDAVADVAPPFGEVDFNDFFSFLRSYFRAIRSTGGR
ncbi:MAG: bifunctional metallophosphatase/5'-nucleotidase [Planctomycetota bacterium]